MKNVFVLYYVYIDSRGDHFVDNNNLKKFVHIIRNSNRRFAYYFAVFKVLVLILVHA